MALDLWRKSSNPGHVMSDMHMEQVPVIGPAAEGEVKRRLRAIEAENDVRILLAVESGSRAWGFESPDSDYDVRFIYVRPRDWYLQLERGRDVIETQIDLPWDINGWDITKALGLMLKSNAVVLEWLTSPIVYTKDAVATDMLRVFADEVLQPSALQHHYRRLAVRHWDEFIAGRNEVARKKYLYALRPALMLMQLRLQGGVPPMSLPALTRDLPLDTEIRQAIDAFITAKRQAKESGPGERVPLFDRIIEDEIARAQPSDTPSPTPELTRRADQLFLELLLSGLS